MWFVPYLILAVSSWSKRSSREKTPLRTCSSSVVKWASVGDGGGKGGGSFAAWSPLPCSRATGSLQRLGSPRVDGRLSLPRAIWKHTNDVIVLHYMRFVYTIRDTEAPVTMRQTDSWTQCVVAGLIMLDNLSGRVLLQINIVFIAQAIVSCIYVHAVHDNCEVTYVQLWLHSFFIWADSDGNQRPD